MISVQDEHHLRVGDRVWWGHFESYDLENEYEWKRRQFVVHFESKWSVSIIWGYCTYSDNHDFPFHFFGEYGQEFTETPTLVEAAVLHADRSGCQPDGDVFAYIDAEQLNTLLSAVSKLATDDQLATDVIADV